VDNFCTLPDNIINNNDLASLFWATEGGVIRNIMDDKIVLPLASMFLFFSVWYFFTITTYGTNLPAGLFLPGMIIGCALGAMYAKVVDYSSVFAGDA
jgi:H+/Cl- antiporter ClcA